MEGALEVLEAQVQGGARRGAAGVVDERVDAAELLHRRVDEALELRPTSLTSVGIARTLRAGLSDLGGGGFEAIGRPRRHDDVRAGLGESERAAETDAGAGTGDDRNLAVQFEPIEDHGGLSWRCRFHVGTR